MSTAPTASVGLSARSSAIPVGTASTTKSNGNRFANHPTASSDTPKCRAATVVVAA